MKKYNKNTSRNNVTIPRWVVFVVVGLVVLLGLYFIYNTYAYQIGSNTLDTLTSEPINANVYCTATGECFADIVPDTISTVVFIRKSSDDACSTGIQWVSVLDNENTNWKCLQAVGD